MFLKGAIKSAHLQATHYLQHSVNRIDSECGSQSANGIREICERLELDDIELTEWEHCEGSSFFPFFLDYRALFTG